MDADAGHGASSAAGLRRAHCGARVRSVSTRVVSRCRLRTTADALAAPLALGLAFEQLGALLAGSGLRNRERTFPGP